MTECVHDFADLDLWKGRFHVIFCIVEYGVGIGNDHDIESLTRQFPRQRFANSFTHTQRHAHVRRSRISPELPPVTSAQQAPYFVFRFCGR